MLKNQKKVLITGGSGFIGKYISDFLIKRNYYVVNFDINETKKIKSKNYQYIKGDIKNLNNLKKAFNKIDYVIHLAAINGTKNFYDYPVNVLQVSSLGILNICNLCEKYNIKKLFIFSSSEVYNQSKNLPTNENVEIKIPDIRNPRFSYSGGKIISELLGLNYSLENRIKKVIIIRPHNVYGPNMGFGHVIPQLYKKIYSFNKNKIKLKIVGKGDEVRSFIFINDFLDGFYKIFQKGKNRQIYNIGNNEPVSIKKLIMIFSNLLKIKIYIKTSKPHLGTPKKRIPNDLKIKKLGYKKKYNIINGLKEFIKYEKKF